MRNFTGVGRSWRKSNWPTVPQWSQRRLVVPSGSFSSTLTPCASSVYLTSRYPTIPLQLLHLAAQYNFSDISSLGAQSASRLRRTVSNGVAAGLLRSLCTMGIRPNRPPQERSALPHGNAVAHNSLYKRTGTICWQMRCRDQPCRRQYSK